MIYSNEAYAKHRIKQAYEALNDAQVLLKSGSPSGAAEIGLRAGKIASEAALAVCDSKSVKMESLVFLVIQFVKSGQLNASSFNAFRTIMDIAQYANERDFAIINQSEVQAAIENLKYFLKEMSDIVKEQTRT